MAGHRERDTPEEADRAQMSTPVDASTLAEEGDNQGHHRVEESALTCLSSLLGARSTRHHHRRADYTPSLQDRRVRRRLRCGLRGGRREGIKIRFWRKFIQQPVMDGIGQRLNIWRGRAILVEMRDDSAHCFMRRQRAPAGFQ